MVHEGYVVNHPVYSRNPLPLKFDCGNILSAVKICFSPFTLNILIEKPQKIQLITVPQIKAERTQPL